MATRKPGRPKEFPSLEPTLIQDVGLTLYGRHWQTELADAVARTPRMVSYWLRDENRPPPASLLADFIVVIDKKVEELEAMNNELKQLSKRLGVDKLESTIKP